MELLFIGTICPHVLRKQLLAGGGYVDYAADTFQEALLSGLKNNNCQVDLISAPVIKSFPKYRKLIQGHIYFNEDGEEKFSGESVGFLNLPVVKLVCKFINLSRLLNKKNIVNTPILIYEVTSFQLLAVTLFARRNRKYLIVLDLPEFMSSNKNIIYRLLKVIDRFIINRTLKYIDGFVLLSSAMTESMNVKNKPWVLVEGIYSVPKANYEFPNSFRKPGKIVLYTGTIEERFGLRDLFEAFAQIEGDEYRLWICGGGDVKMVEEYAKKDDRIVYYGVVSRNKVLEMQREATLLVNPRHSNEEFTKYSFPSKTMEYMASGTPTLMCKLESIPEEYHKHLFFFEDESVLGMSSRIKELLDAPYDEMNDFGRAASEFIKVYKNSKIQTERILNMIVENR